MTITLGSIKIRHPVFLAPLSGITDLPTRRIFREQGVGLVYSEMLASREIMSRPVASNAACAAPKMRKPLAIQIAGCEAYWMGEAARICAPMLGPKSSISIWGVRPKRSCMAIPVRRSCAIWIWRQP